MSEQHGVWWNAEQEQWIANGEAWLAWFDNELDAWRWLAGNLSIAVGLLRERVVE